jgi:AcrR family transcriptional regulator
VPAAKPEGQAATRRRGRELQQAILSAVLEELAETGYVGLTVEGVAARARTSRPVLHRRWPTRAELVLAALSETRPRGNELSDTGSFRSDVIVLLQQVRRRFADIGPEVIWGLMAETARDPGLTALVRAQFVQTVSQELMTTLLDRAIARGEFGPDRPGPRVIAMPVDLLVHDLLIYGKADDGEIISVVDEALLPLLRPGTHSS